MTSISVVPLPLLLFGWRRGTRDSFPPLYQSLLSEQLEESFAEWLSCVYPEVIRDVVLLIGKLLSLLLSIHSSGNSIDPSLPMQKMMENEAFVSFIFFGTLLVIKMYAVAVITGQVRLRKKAFANPEDALRHGGLQYHREDPDVERCRRAHLNDMENIYPFLFLGAIYSLLDPNPTVARIHFLIFFFGRIVHTLAYLLKLRAPTRSVAYSVAQLPCVSMALQILFAAIKSW
uniref:Prostaglandin E synthase n=2 Tax=Podarcis muralis TaxID=64176 RepID=A0A670KGT4_PODMU